MKKRMRIGILVVVGALLFSPTIPLAAQGQMQDSSRRLYDRVMEEFKHRDYEAALAGFRFFIEVHGHSPLLPTPNIGSGNVSTDWGATRTPWPRFTMSSRTIPSAQNWQRRP